MDEARQREWWHRWLGEYWRGRLSGKPEELHHDEVRHMLGWLPRLTAVFPEAVGLATRMPSVELQQSTIIRDIAERGAWWKYPDAIAKLLLHLWRSYSPHDAWHRGQEVVAKLLESNISPELKRRLKKLADDAG